MQTMKSRHAQELENTKFELDVLRSEHLIEVEMLKKELEDARSKADKLQPKPRNLELPRGPESEYDSSDVGSRDQSPAVEALHEQLLTLQGSYEEEMASLREQLQAQVAKTNEVVEKLEQQEFEFNEALSDLKNKSDQERDALSVEHQNELSTVRSSYEERLKLQEARHKERIHSTSSAKDDLEFGSGDVSESHDQSHDQHEVITALKAEHEVYMDAVKEQYEKELGEMKQQIQKKEKQFANREDQMADDMMTMHAEYEKQVGELKEQLAGKDRELERGVSQLRGEMQELKDKHQKEFEEAQLRYQKELEALQERQGSLGEVSKEAEGEMQKLRDELQKERKDFTEVRELLESTITEQEQQLARKGEQSEDLARSYLAKEQDLRAENERSLQELCGRHTKEIEKLKEDHDEELRAMATNEQSKEDGRVDVETLQRELEKLKARQEQELREFREGRESLQMENEELKNEFDLLRSSLSRELETSESEPGTSPQSLRVQLENFRELKEGELRVLAGQLGEYKEKVSSLETEVRKNSEEEEARSGDKRKVEELENELEAVKEKSAGMESRLETEVRSLQTELEQLTKKNQEFAKGKDHEGSKVAELEGVIEELKATHGYLVEEYEERITEAQNEKSQQEQTWQKEREENEREMLQLEGKLEELEERKGVQEAEKEALERKISQHTDTIDGLRQQCMDYQKEKRELESEMALHRQGFMEKNQSLQVQVSEYENKVTQLSKAMDQLERDCAVYRERNTALEEQSEELRRAENDLSSVALYEQTLDFEDQISELKKTVENLTNECREREVENKKLRGKNVEVIPGDSEQIVSAASIEDVFAEDPEFMRGDEVPAGGIALEYEQQNKELLEEFENRIEDLESQLSESKNALLSKGRQLNSVNVEMNALRESLEDERKAVQNLEDRLVKLNSKHEDEVRALKEKFAKEKLGKQDELSGVKSQAEAEERVRNVEAESMTKRNNELREELERMSEELEERKKRYHGDISSVQRNFENASSNVERLKAALEKESEITREQEEEISKLKGEFEQRRRSDEETSAAEMKEKQEAEQNIENLTKDLNDARSVIKKQQHELKKLKGQLQESAQNRVKEMRSIEERLALGYTEDVGSLKTDLEVALAANDRQAKEIASLKEKSSKLEEELTEASTNHSAEKSDLRHAHAQKIEALERELKSRSEEVASLVSLLDTEQKGRERVLLDTEKHLAHVGRTEEEKTRMEREIAELRVRAKSLERELDRERKNHSKTLSQVEKQHQSEHEEVRSLNRSFNESEFERGKLVSQIRYWKDEAEKVQERYNKLREKFGLLKEKRREDKQKHAELLLTPRSDMGLQIDLLQVEEFEAAKHKASASLLEQSRLEEDIESLEHEASRMKVEMQALRKANGILRKQNQTLYLETERLGANSEQQNLALDRLQEESRLLQEVKATLTAENKNLSAMLEEKGADLERTKELKVSLEAENRETQTELRKSQQKEVQFARENDHLKDENVFYVKQAKRLQFQVEQLENELENSLRNPASFSPELGQGRPKLHLMPLEFKPHASQETKDTATVLEQNQKLQAEVDALQQRLISKDQELRLNTSERKPVVESLGQVSSPLDGRQGELEPNLTAQVSFSLFVFFFLFQKQGIENKKRFF